MKTSPIQLMQLTFKHVQVAVDPAHAPTEPSNPMITSFVFDGVSITTEVGVADIDMTGERGPLYLVSLRVVVDNQPAADEANPKYSPYLIDIEAAGVILLLKSSADMGPAHDLVTVNGASLLWSAIREQLLTLTSRMPSGAVMLPTVHFHDLKQSALPALPEATVSAPAPPPAKKRAARSKQSPAALP